MFPLVEGLEIPGCQETATGTVIVSTGNMAQTQDPENLVAYVQRSLEDEEDFHFLKHEFLHRLNITQLGVQLVRMKSRIQRDGKAPAAELNTLQTTLRDYGAFQRDGAESTSLYRPYSLTLS